MDAKHGQLLQQTKNAGTVLPPPVSQNVSASAPRRTASAAALPGGPAGVPLIGGQKFLVVPAADGKPQLSRQLTRMDTKDSLATDDGGISPPPSPAGTNSGSKTNKPAGTKADGVRKTAGLIKDPASAFTILRADWDARRGTHSADPYARIWVKPYGADNNWLANFQVTELLNSTVPEPFGRLAQVTAGSTPAANQRLGAIVKLEKMIMQFKFWGATYSPYNGSGTINLNFPARLQTPKHRLVIFRDKWPDIGAPVWAEIIQSDTTQTATSINALMLGFGEPGVVNPGNLQRCNTELKQNPLTKGVRFEIIHDETWVPGTNYSNSANMTVAGGYMYRSWLEHKQIDITDKIKGMEQYYAGPLDGDLFTNDLNVFVMMDETPQATQSGLLIDVVASTWDWSYYQGWSDMQEATGGLQPSLLPGVPTPTSLPTAAAAAK